MKENPYRLIRKKSGKKVLWYVIQNEKSGPGRCRQVIVDRLGPVSKAEAERSMARYNAGVSEKKSGRTTLETVYAEFSKLYETQSKPRTFQSFRWCMDIIVEKIGYIEISGIAYKDVELIKKTLIERGWSNRSVNIGLIELSKLLKYAIRSGHLSKMPEIDKMSEAKANVIDRLTKEQINDILAHSDVKQRFFIEFMLQTGMRPQEFDALEWSQVDFKEKSVHVISDSKTKLGRVIPMTEPLKKLLFAVPAESRHGRVSPWETRWGAFQAMRKLGIKAYTLRKTFASAMVEAGVPVFELAKLMGHTDISTTYKYYTNLQHHTLRGAMEKNPF